jgi:hypothetical protein
MYDLDLATLRSGAGAYCGRSGLARSVRAAMIWTGNRSC